MKISEKDLKRYEELAEAARQAKSLFNNPIEFQMHQHELLHAIAEFLLYPYEESFEDSSHESE